MSFGDGINPRRDQTPRYNTTTGKRVRQTFGTHANTAHVWAQQEFAYGRSGDGRVFFHGQTVYSHGTHYAIAFFSDHVHDGKRLVLYNGAGYSVSTSQHSGHVLSALNGLPVLVVEVPDLRDWVTYNHELQAPSANALRAAFDALLEQAASSARDVSSNDDYSCQWNSARRDKMLAGARALRAVFKLRAIIPPDLIAWQDKRRAIAAKAKRVSKIKAARALIGTGSLLYSIPDAWAEASEDGGKWAIERVVRDILSTETKLRSARLTLGKKRFPAYVRRASAALRALKPIREAWQLSLLKRAYLDARETNFCELRQVAGVLNGTATEDGLHGWNVDKGARLWSFALNEGLHRLANYLRDRVHVLRFEREIDWRVPYRPLTSGPKVTLEAWHDGIGGASQYGDGFGYDKTAQVRRKGDRLETSRGAVVPWKRALAVFKLAQECRNASKVWERNGEQFKIGHYNLDRVTITGAVVAGCHLLGFDEMKQLAIREAPAMVVARYPLPAIIGVKN